MCVVLNANETKATKKKVAEVLIIVILRSQQSINNHTPCENAHSLFTTHTHFVVSVFFFGENKIWFFIAFSTNRLPSAYTFDNYSLSATIENAIKHKKWCNQF